jgi:hypothetical protein
MLATTIEGIAASLPWRVQKATVDGERVVLELYKDGGKRWLVLRPGLLEWCEERPPPREGGEPPTLQGVLRKELVPSVLAEATWAPPLARLLFSTASAPRPRVVVVEHTGDARAVLCVCGDDGGDAKETVLAVLGAARPVDGRDLRRGRPYEAPRAPTPFRGAVVVADAPDAASGGAGGPRKAVDPLADTRAALKAEAKRLRRLVDALAHDLKRHGDASVHETEGELLKTVLAHIARGHDHVDVVDWEGNPRTLTLDPTKDARANLEERFKRARRARASAERTTPRLAEATARLEAVEVARGALSESTLDAAKALLARPATASSARRTAAKAGARQAWRSFRCSGDVVVRVGRGARDNDALVKSARGNDVWLHARNHQGAHVIIPASAVRSTGDVDPELLLDAAHLAAHFSSARGEARVDVQHTHVKHLKKPGPGAPAGLVHVAKESVLHLRVDDPRMQALLAREVPA